MRVSAFFVGLQMNILRLCCICRSCAESQHEWHFGNAQLWPGNTVANMCVCVCACLYVLCITVALAVASGIADELQLSVLQRKLAIRVCHLDATFASLAPLGFADCHHFTQLIWHQSHHELAIYLPNARKPPHLPLICQNWTRTNHLAT